MSTTPNTDNTTPAPKRPDPAQLSGATATVWAALNNQPGATSIALAQTAGVGRSTTTKALRHLEQTGLAHRESASPDGSGRPVNYWYPTPDPDTSTSPDTTDEPPTADDDGHELPTEHDHPTPTAESPASKDNTSEHGDADEDAEQESASEPSRGAENDDGPAPSPESEPPTSEAAPDTNMEEPQPTVSQSSYRTRLAPGALRQMVVDHLTAHPNEAFTATRISRTIEKSSGAIANALVTLTKQGTTEQVTERPRTYRLTTPPSRDHK